MHATLARGIATAALAAGFAGAGLYLFGNAPAGTFGLSPSFLPGAPLLRVDSVAPGGPAERAGLLAGDVLSARGRSLDDRSSLVLLANLPLVAVGDRAAIVVNRGAQRRDAELNAAPNPESPRLEAVYFAALSMPLLLLGWLIVWKKPRSDDAVTLGAMLMLLGLWNAVPDRIGGAFERLIWYQIVGSLLVTLGVFLAVVFFARYPAGSALGASPLRRLLLRVAVAFTVVQTAGLAYFFVAPVFFGTVPWVVVIGTWSAVVTPLAALACFIDAFRHGDAIERTRLRWLGASFFLGFSGPLLIPPAFGILGPGFTVIHQVLFESTLFILALGLAYAILRRRVMDIAFVLNRALVFSAVSAIVVTLFITFEWLIGLVFIHLSRPTSFTVEVIAAVIIGFSLRPIHERVDRVIDRVFFARRHAAEKALHHRRDADRTAPPPNGNCRRAGGPDCRPKGLGRNSRSRREDERRGFRAGRSGAVANARRISRTRACNERPGRPGHRR